MTCEREKTVLSEFPLNRKQTLIIAEAGVNHNGNIDLAEQLVDAAVEAGVDAVKFQSYITEELVCRHAQLAHYQKKNERHRSNQFDLLKRYELDFETQKEIFKYCKKKKIQFLSSVFDHNSLEFLVNELRLPLLKIPSGEIINAPLLIKAARSHKPMIISTGMCTRKEIENALGVVAFGATHPTGWPVSEKELQGYYHSEEGMQWLRKNVYLLHCTTEYPTPFCGVHLNAMKAMAQTFGLETGYSDHTTGIHVAVAAVALGAAIIEKHFTLDRNLPGPDHSASLEPQELKNMVLCVRQVEKSLGSIEKCPTPTETRNRLVIRKSIVATRRILKGERFRTDNIGCKRPGNGISPMQFWNLIGTSSDRIYEPDALIEFSDNEDSIKG